MKSPRKSIKSAPVILLDEVFANTEEFSGGMLTVGGWGGDLKFVSNQGYRQHVPYVLLVEATSTLREDRSL